MTKGFTIIEAVIAVSLIMILSTLALIAINPQQSFAKARDNTRLARLATLDRIINEYKIDFGVYPDSLGILRTSITPLSLDTGSVNSATNGWIQGDFLKYNAVLPTDPINNDQYYFSYMHSASGYELDTHLEYYKDLAENDGGNNVDLYELGNELTIM